MKGNFTMIDAVTEERESSASAAWGDWLGLVASIGCAIHCAAMPFVIAYLPALGLSFLADEAFHQWMALACFVIALAAFVPGFRNHGSVRPMVIASVGLAMITFAAFGLAGECCPACPGGEPPIASTGATGCSSEGCTHCASEAMPVASTEGGGCTDPGCGDCEDKEPPISLVSASFTSSEQSNPSWLSLLAPWITPIGGIVLVSAHLLNRRYDCRCGCCSDPSSAETIG